MTTGLRCETASWPRRATAGSGGRSDEVQGGEAERSAGGGDGRWEDAIAKALHMPDTMPDAIRDMWKKNLKIAHDNKVTLTPQQFAEMFVDSNFAG